MLKSPEQDQIKTFKYSNGGSMPKTKSKPHPEISQVMIIDGCNNFPISWLNKQGYCEYSIYLENVKGIEVKPTRNMVVGTQEHARLEMEFQKDAEPATFEEMLGNFQDCRTLIPGTPGHFIPLWYPRIH